MLRGVADPYKFLSAKFRVTSETKMCPQPTRSKWAPWLKGPTAGTHARIPEFAGHCSGCNYGSRLAQRPANPGARAWVFKKAL